MNYARITNNTVQEVIDFDPAERFHTTIAAMFTQVPVTAHVGYSLVAGVWTAPAPVASTPLPVVYPILTPTLFYVCFTTQERIAIKASTDPVVVELLATLNMCLAAGAEINLNLASTRADVQYMETIGLLAPGRYAQIIAGVPQ